MMESAPKMTTWTHKSADRTYVCSTDPSRLDLGALNAALGSDMLWWANALPRDRLRTMVDNCLIFGLYLVKTGDAASQVDGQPAHEMIGCARVISDRVTFGYLTDVYVLPEHQQRGIGTFLVRCVNEELESWPELRGFWILSSNAQAQRLYEKVCGTVDFFATNTNANIRLLEKKGPWASH